MTVHYVGGVGVIDSYAELIGSGSRRGLYSWNVATRNLVTPGSTPAHGLPIRLGQRDQYEAGTDVGLNCSDVSEHVGVTLAPVIYLVRDPDQRDGVECCVTEYRIMPKTW